MQLYIIRHAQSANNALYAAGGPEAYDANRFPDPPVTELGHEQAKVLARHLATQSDGAALSNYANRHNRGGYGLTHLYTSLMIRAITTATYIAEATGLPLHAWTEMYERGGLHDLAPETGEPVIVAGPNRAYFTAEYPHLVLPDTLGEVGWWNRGREPEEEYMPRARLFWQQLIERHGASDDRVALVTHAGFVQSLLAVVFGLENTGNFWFGISNTSITRLEYKDGFAGLRYMNKVDHLPGELITG